MNIWEKLLAMQIELKAPKNMYNDFGRYSYRNAESILQAAKPLADKYKVCLLIFDTIEDKAHGTYITAHARLVDTEKPEDVVEVTASAREADQKKGMDTMQITGCASSYARKYALNGLFCINDIDDSDALEPEQETKQEAKPKYFCNRCGRAITDRVHGGNTYTADQIYKNAMRVHKTPLCWDCYNLTNREVTSGAKTAN